MTGHKIFKDAAGYHVVWIKNDKVVGWSYNHKTIEAARKAAKRN